MLKTYVIELEEMCIEISYYGSISVDIGENFYSKGVCTHTTSILLPTQHLPSIEYLSLTYIEYHHHDIVSDIYFFLLKSLSLRRNHFPILPKKLFQLNCLLF